MNRSTSALFAAALALLPLPGLAAPGKSTPKPAAARPLPAPVPVAVPGPVAPAPSDPAVTEPPVKVEPETIRGKITAVDRPGQTLQVRLDKRGLRTIYIVQLPKGPDGKPGVTWDQLKVGAEVEVLVRKDGRKLVAETLAVVR